MRPRAICFDLGGTLIATPSLPETLRELASIPIHRELALDSRRLELLGRLIQRTIWNYAARNDDRQLHWVDAWSQSLKEMGLPNGKHLAATLNKLHIRAMHERSKAYSYTPELLELLHIASIPICLISNVTGPPDVFDDLLREQRVLHFFRYRVWSSEIAVRKPHKAAYQCALRRLGVTATKAVVMVGDDETADIEAANRVGLTSVRVVHNGDTAQSKASHIVADSNIMAFFKDLTA